VHQVRQVLRFVRSQYGFVVADLGRGCSPFMFGALEELDELFLVITFEVPVLRHAKQLLECLARTGYPKDRVRLLLNRADKRSDITPGELETMLSHPVYAVIPNRYLELNEVYSEGSLLGAGSPLNRHFGKLAARIAGIPEKEPEKKRGFSLFG
jgi:pilus assembly protein CpaE